MKVNNRFNGRTNPRHLICIGGARDSHSEKVTFGLNHAGGIVVIQAKRRPHVKTRGEREQLVFKI